MHYSVDYSSFTDEVAKHNCAIQDIKEYLGEERFKNITQIAKDQPEPFTLEQFTLAVSFAGVQGYPVKAWYNYCYPL